LGREALEDGRLRLARVRLGGVRVRHARGDESAVGDEPGPGESGRVQQILNDKFEQPAKELVLVFSVFITLSFDLLKQFGVGLSAAVLIDATIIRTVLVPASLKLLGDWNWNLPSWLEWLPRIAFATETEPIPRNTSGAGCGVRKVVGRERAARKRGCLRPRAVDWRTASSCKRSASNGLPQERNRVPPQSSCSSTIRL
jgi:hypothetical protein